MHQAMEMKGGFTRLFIPFVFLLCVPYLDDREGWSDPMQGNNHHGRENLGCKILLKREYQVIRCSLGSRELTPPKISELMW